MTSTTPIPGASHGLPGAAGLCPPLGLRRPDGGAVLLGRKTGAALGLHRCGAVGSPPYWVSDAWMDAHQPSDVEGPQALAELNLGALVTGTS